MPTYEYRCKDCGHEFEINQSFTDDALTECPECHGALKKKFGSVGIAFKGSGFYKTDSRSSGSGPSSSGSTSTSSSDGGTSSGDGGATTKATESTPSKPAKSDTSAPSASSTSAASSKQAASA